MQIVSVTVGLGMTESLTGFANVKPSLMLTATLERVDSVDRVVEELARHCREFCESAIDDALERAGERPKFYRGRLFRLFRWVQRDALYIVPLEFNVQELPGRWEVLTPAQRYNTAMGHALDEADGRLVADLCGPMALEEMQQWWAARKWYRAYGFDNGFGRLEKIVVVRGGLEVPKLLCYLSTELSGIDRQLPDAISEVTAFEPEVEVVVMDDQDELNQLVEEWVKQGREECEDDAAF